MKVPVAVSLVLVAVAAITAVVLGTSAAGSSSEFGVASPPLASVSPAIVDPQTPRLSRRVVLVVIDGLRFDHSQQPFLDELRSRGVAAHASAIYPTWSRPGYVSALTGVPPPASGVRTNRVVTPVPFDSIMERARAAGLHVATAGDIGMIPPLFLRPIGADLRQFDYHLSRDKLAAPPGYTWPFDDSRWADSRSELEESAGSVLAGNADLVIILAGDVDRAGHAYGGGSTQYAEAAANVDRALGHILAKVDLERDTIIVIADHGHTDRGGHGGIEAEVTTVPLILAGAGIVRGAVPADATLVDISPTIATLLAIPAPGHGSGRTLVELLSLEPSAAARRTTADAIRHAAIALPPPGEGPDPLRFAIAACATALGVGLALYLRQRGAMTFGTGAAAGVVGYAMLICALLVSTQGDFSPSAVPPVHRLEMILLLSGPTAVISHLVANLLVLRRRPAVARLATANGLGFVGIAIALIPIGGVRVWLYPPHVAVPSPFWLVGIPAAEIAGFFSAIAVGLLVLVELAVFALRKPT
jgi:type I phosphodiesterase/nucleotide pyrophosphatase